MKKSKNVLKVALKAALISILFVGVSVNGLLASAESKMPNFTLPSVVDGEIIDTRNLEGNVSLINFFATWCGPCRREIPELIKLQDKYGEEHFSVVGISVDRGKKTLAKFVKKMKINYPVALGDKKVTKEFGGVDGIPASFLVDRTGNVVKSYSGYIDPLVFHDDVARMMQ